jgi:hypothetical protein
MLKHIFYLSKWITNNKIKWKNQWINKKKFLITPKNCYYLNISEIDDINEKMIYQVTFIK